MKIFLAFLQSAINHPIPAYSFWQYYLKNGIEEAGDSWTEHPQIDWALGIVPKSKDEHSKWLNESWQKAVDYIKKNPPDIFLSYLYPEQVNEQAIKEIQKAGVPCVNFFCDNVRQFSKIPDIYKVFDLNWVPEYEALGMYKQAGAPCINLPMPTWVAPKFRVLPKESLAQATFIGSEDRQRAMLFEAILRKRPGLDLKIYGRGWQDNNNTVAEPNDGSYTLGKKIKFQADFIRNQGIGAYYRKLRQRNACEFDMSDALKSRINPSPGFEEYIGLTAQSLVTIGVNRYPDLKYPLHKPNSYSRLRDIEAPMLGACYLTEWADGIDELYNTEKEILTYTDADSFIAQYEKLARQPSLRESLRKNGQHKALENHSIPLSIKRIKGYLFN